MRGVHNSINSIITSKFLQNVGMLHFEIDGEDGFIDYAFSSKFINYFQNSKRNHWMG